MTKQDSGAEVALAILTIVSVLALLGWAASKVIRLARKSITQHKNPAYILYSDPATLNKWGFLYVQFKATACCDSLYAGKFMFNKALAAIPPQIGVDVISSEQSGSKRTVVAGKVIRSGVTGNQICRTSVAEGSLKIG